MRPTNVISMCVRVCLFCCYQNTHKITLQNWVNLTMHYTNSSPGEYEQIINNSIVTETAQSVSHLYTLNLHNINLHKFLVRLTLQT